MTLYMGVDFHPHQQTVCWCEHTTGEIKLTTLFHNAPALKEFYQTRPAAIVGIEAATNALWFEALLADTGHELRGGKPALIRAKATSRHKSDKRAAELIFDLLSKNEFPPLWRRARASSQVLELLKLRLSFVTQRTQRYNRLQALGHSFGLPKARMKTLAQQTALKECPANEAQELHRTQLFTALEHRNERIRELDTWLQAPATSHAQMQRLQTQVGVGVWTALAVVHGVGDVPRFTQQTSPRFCRPGTTGKIQRRQDQVRRHQQKRQLARAVFAGASRTPGSPSRSGLEKLQQAVE